MDDKKAILIERIKVVIVEMIHYSQDLPKTNFSEFLSNKLSYDYTYMANLFLIHKELQSSIKLFCTK